MTDTKTGVSAPQQRCGKPAMDFIPRQGLTFTCVLPLDHDGACRPGGHCFTHGDYVGEAGKPPTCPSCPQMGGWPSVAARASAPAEDRPFNNVDAIRQWASGLSPSNSERIRLECVFAEVRRLTAALHRVREDARITLRQIADFCDGEARAPHSAVYTAVRALEDARNLCLAALNDEEPMDAARARLSLTCMKAEHIGDGFLHAANDDGPYDVDGIQYCGRCHGLAHPPASSDPTARTQPEGSND